MPSTVYLRLEQRQANANSNIALLRNRSIRCFSGPTSERSFYWKIKTRPILWAEILLLPYHINLRVKVKSVRHDNPAGKTSYLRFITFSFNNKSELLWVGIHRQQSWSILKWMMNLIYPDKNNTSQIICFRSINKPPSTFQEYSDGLLGISLFFVLHNRKISSKLRLRRCQLSGDGTTDAYFQCNIMQAALSYSPTANSMLDIYTRGKILKLFLSIKLGVHLLWFWFNQ